MSLCIRIGISVLVQSMEPIESLSIRAICPSTGIANQILSIRTAFLVAKGSHPETKNARRIVMGTSHEYFDLYQIGSIILTNRGGFVSACHLIGLPRLFNSSSFRALSGSPPADSCKGELRDLQFSLPTHSAAATRRAVCSGILRNVVSAMSKVLPATPRNDRY